MMMRLRNLLIGSTLIFGGLVGMLGLSVAAAPVASAASCPGGRAHLLTFPAWYDGLVNEDCTLKSVGNGPDDLRNFIVRIVLNVIEILLQLVGYACTVFIMLGGFKYMTNTGDPSQYVTARKTIMNAVIGLVISIGSVVIVNTIAGALTP